jgi:branched-chain amino acid transport system substrate-binding protein
VVLKVYDIFGNKIILSLVLLIVIVVGVVISYGLGLIRFPISSEDVIRIGFLGPFSGPAADIGKDFKIGAEEAVKDINNAGGLLGRKVVLIYGDDESKVDIGVAVAERLITSDRVHFLVGTFHSSIALAVMEVAAKYKIPYIISTAASTEIGKKILSNPLKYKYIFQANINSTAWQLAYMYPIEYAIEKGIWKPQKKILAIVVEDTDWGRASGELWKSIWSNRGWTIAVYEITPPQQTDFYSILNKIKQSGAEVVKAEFSLPPTLAAFVKQFKEVGVKAWLVLGSAHWSNEFVRLTGDALEYSIGTFEYIPKEYKERFAKLGAGDYAIQAYEAIMVLADAVKRAGSLDPDKVVAALEKTNYKGIRGLHAFSESHCQIGAPGYIFPAGAQYREGRFWLVTPPHIERDIEVPPWLRG